MEYHIERQTDIDLQFTGDKLADQTSKEPGSLRWQEVRIYKTDSNKYVTEVVGQTLIDGERIFRTVTVCDKPLDVREALFRWKNGRKYLNDLTLDALEEAGESDQAIYDMLQQGERI